MEEKNKSKNAAGVAIILIIGVLIIALISCIIHIKKINDNLLAQNKSNNNVQQESLNTNQESNIKKEENKDTSIKDNTNKEESNKKGLEILGIGDDFIELSKAAKAVLESDSLEYDLNNDGVKEKISTKYEEND